MATILTLCSGCSRHIKTTELTCPFCASAVTAAMRAAEPPRPLARGLSRAALLLAGAAAVAACGKETKSPDPAAPPATSPVDLGNVSAAAAYGAPPPMMLDAAVPISPPGANDAGSKK